MFSEFKFKFSSPAEVIPAECVTNPASCWILTSDMGELVVHMSDALYAPEGHCWATDFGGTVNSWTTSLEVLRVLPNGSRIIREEWFGANGYSWRKLYLVRA